MIGEQGEKGDFRYFQWFWVGVRVEQSGCVQVSDE
jgi:hypothetical protein